MNAATKAVDLAPDLVEARTSLAHVLLHTGDLTGAEREFKRAQKINRNYALAYHWYGEYLRLAKRSDEALVALRWAKQLDPLDLAINAELGFLFITTGQYEVALNQYLDTLKINPNYFLAHLGLGNVYLKMAKYPDAISEFKKVEELTKGNRGLERLGYAYALSGQRENALAVLTELQARVAKQRPVEPLGSAAIYVALGDKDRAFAQIEKALKQSPTELVGLGSNSDFDSLRSDTRYIELVKHVGGDR